MIDKIELKSGSSTGQKNLNIDITPITVFVGPNNSGKSRILIEIENAIRNGQEQTGDLILNKITYTSLIENEIEEEINNIEEYPTLNDNIQKGNKIIGKLNPQDNQAKRFEINPQDLIRESLNPNSQRNWTFPKFLSLYTIRLDGSNRLNLLREQSAGDLQLTPTNHLAHLFLNNSLRSEVRRIIYDAFEKYYVIDPTKSGYLRVRLSDTAPKTEQQERGWDQDAIDFHKKGLLIENTSDGVKAFTGIITTILAGDPKISLIDEPEAFLHPALSNKLGKEIGQSLRNTNKRLIAATHSSSFLMGCIQSGSPLNIVRLTYKNGVATSRILEKEKILYLMRHPLLRSTGVLNGLFYEAVIVTEADSDRAFYQEINERLITKNDRRGISNCLFLNAQNKQTVWDIVKPLRELGIPAVGIVDIDVFKEGGQVFTKLLEGAYLPSLNHKSFHNQRKEIYDKLNETEKRWKIEGGIEVLEGENKEACENFLNQLDEYGVFIVRNGELESWLKHMKIAGHGSKWLIDIFSKMGENPDSKDYLQPAGNDVWEFIGKIKEWIELPTRKGIPK
ncbi:ATP-dependent nuclease [Flavobacterium sp. XS1P32]|uniref:ATP-dependent nuclease n=1 Tax=unclassified Flavobacterium TaxID=196869 RepID=UPI003AAA79FE